jgi:hypothetical protein
MCGLSFYFILFLKNYWGLEGKKWLPVWSVVLCDWGIANCCVCCCRLHYFTGSSTDLHTWPAVDYKSCCFCFCLQLLPTLNPMVNWNTDITVHNKRHRETTHSTIQWSIGTQTAPYKRQKESDRVSTSAFNHHKHTHTNWNDFYLWNWICAIYWGVGMGVEPKEDIP